MEHLEESLLYTKQQQGLYRTKKSKAFGKNQKNRKWHDSCSSPLGEHPSDDEHTVKM